MLKGCWLMGSLMYYWWEYKENYYLFWRTLNRIYLSLKCAHHYDSTIPILSTYWRTVENLLPLYKEACWGFLCHCDRKKRNWHNIHLNKLWFTYTIECYCPSPQQTTPKYPSVAYWQLWFKVTWKAASARRTRCPSPVSLNARNKAPMWPLCSREAKKDTLTAAVMEARAVTLT